MVPYDSITPRQVRAARVLLGVTQETLAARAGIGPRTLADFETGARTPNRATLRAIAAALTESGVDLLDREGVALAATRRVDKP
jgi:transcriptional regulator with XRE-family HTH domain